MNELASTYTNSFDQAMSEIKTIHIYAEQEQMYDGFMKLLEKQREFVFARKDLASKLKSVITEPLSSESRIQNLEEVRVIPMESTTRVGGIVHPSNEAHMYPQGDMIITKGKIEQENPFMVSNRQLSNITRCQSSSSTEKDTKVRKEERFQKSTLKLLLRRN